MFFSRIETKYTYLDRYVLPPGLKLVNKQKKNKNQGSPEVTNVISEL